MEKNDRKNVEWQKEQGKEHHYYFICHSRENGNTESRFRVKHGMTRGQCGMTGKTMSPRT